MISKMAKCPFFGEECLEEKCLSFERKDEYETIDAGGSAYAIKVINEKRGYCKALKMFLPELQELGEGK